jgi:hypothetical protein
MLRRSILAAALVGLLPVPIARAADIQPTVTMDPVPSSVYRGENALFYAHVSHVTEAGVDFESSTDGATWEKVTGSVYTGDDSYFGNRQVEGSVPLGIRYLRARMPASPGFLEAVSATQEQEVLIHEASILDFRIFNPDGWVILPESQPVRVYAQANRGDIVLERKVAGGWDELFRGISAEGWTDVSALGAGEHTFRARVPEDEFLIGTSQEKAITVAKGETTPTWFGDLTVQAGHSLSGQVSVNALYGGVPIDGTMTVKNVATDAVIATGEVGMQFTIPAMTVGSHAFLVTYAGNANYGASEKTFTITVTNNIVEASGVTTNLSAFYPVKDGYRDSVSMVGNRLEPLSVSIRIYNSTGGLAKSASLSRAAGKYSYAWNGRTTSGSLRPSGRYRVVQTLKDASGASRSFTTYVSLSHKKLVTKTAYLTKNGSSISAKGDPGTGSISLSTAGGYAKLTGKWPNGWVGVGYQFTLPSATVYKSIQFQVYSKGPLSVPPSFIAVQNFVICPYSSTAPWDVGCFNHPRSIGSTSTAWFSTSGNVTNNRHGKTVRGMVSVDAFTQTIYKARVKVVYAVLQ